MENQDDLQALENLRLRGMITEKEYHEARYKIIGRPATIWGMEEHTFLMLMHLSQLTGFVLPLVMWLTNKENPIVNRHGENIANFMISMYIYMSVAAVSCIFLIGFLILPVLGIIQIVYIIRVGLDADKYIYSKYPLSITFINND